MAALRMQSSHMSELSFPMPSSLQIIMVVETSSWPLTSICLPSQVQGLCPFCKRLGNAAYADNEVSI